MRYPANTLVASIHLNDSIEHGKVFFREESEPAYQSVLFSLARLFRLLLFASFLTERSRGSLHSRAQSVKSAYWVAARGNGIRSSKSYW